MNIIHIDKLIKILRVHGYSKIADAVSQLNIDIPFVNPETGFETSSLVSDIIECGTPIDPDDNNELVLGNIQVS